MRGGFGRRISSGEEEDFSLKKLDKQALRFIFKYLKEHIKTLLIATMSMFMVTLATLAGPFLSKIAIDSYITKGNLDGLNWIFILMLIIMYGAYQLIPISSAMSMSATGLPRSVMIYPIFIGGFLMGLWSLIYILDNIKLLFSKQDK